MRNYNWVIIFILVGCTNTLTAQEATFTDVTVLRVVDGDTWDVRATLPVGVSFNVRLRPLGLDCAEPNGDTREEGLRQASVLEDLLFSTREHRLVVHGVDNFGRWLVEAWADTTEVTPYMIENSCESYRLRTWRR